MGRYLLERSRAGRAAPADGGCAEPVRASLTSPVPVAGLALLLALTATALAASAATAGVVQVDVSAIFDADVVVNDGSGSLDPTQLPIDSGSVATGNFAFPTRSVAVRQAGPLETPDGLPDDAFFPASAFHPDVQLGWKNSDDGVNARRLSFAAGSFDFPVPPDRYTELHLFATGGDGDADLTVTLRYSDASLDVVTLRVDDWFDDPAETSSAYRLFDGGDRINPGSGPGTPFAFEDRDDTAIAGLRLNPDPAKTLVGVTVDRTDALGVFNFFGATAVTAGTVQPDLYESADPASVLLPANRVASGVVSPHRHTPAAGPALYYQVDDGSGSPALILLVKAGSEVELTF